MSGITDEAALESHDLIHNAEVEEQKAHGDKALTEPYDEGDDNTAPTTTANTGPGNTGKKEGHHSAMDKVKEALHMKK